MSVQVRDTLSGRMVEVGESGRIGLYVCGPTVYNHIHIGNARAPLFWDVVVRYLRSRGYGVTLVQNITDIEDKIINKANEEGVSWEEIVRRYTDSFHERLRLLGIDLPDVEPRATEHIPEMISLIEDLIESGHAYAPGNGDVYYDIESYPRYGQLSKQRPDEMRETEKAATGYKKSPLDFALWKASKPGEPAWESPWGPGRPGWHIECSAMVEKHLPDGADIHGGGTDLRFPHHENELAQSAGAHPDHTFVRAWAHHGMVNLALEGQVSNKMAKSLGNVLDVERAADLHGQNAIRMWFLQSHYSQPIDYSEEILDEKRRSYEHLLRLYRQISRSDTSSELSDDLAAELEERFDRAMRDDLNTPEAVAAIFEVTHRAGQEIAAHPEAAREFSALKEALEEILRIFGFTTQPIHKLDLTAAVGATAGIKAESVPEEGLDVSSSDSEENAPLYARDESSIREIIEEIAGTETADTLEKEMQENGRIDLTTNAGKTVWIDRGSVEGMPSEKVTLRVQVRRRARQMKDWAAADKLRESVRAEGWEIEDTPGDPILSRR